MLRRIFSTNWTRNTKNLFKFLSNDVSQLNEQKLSEILKSKISGEIKVQDVSGGCGAMFEVYVKSKDFKNLTLVKQHKLINEILKEEVKQMHGIRIFTETG